MKTITTLFKTTALAAVMFFASVGTTKAQFDVGDNVLNLGVGLGSTLLGSYSGSNFSQTPAIGLSFEHGTWELGDGTVSLGGYLGYKAFKDDYSYGGYVATSKWTYTIIGIRGAYHFPLDNEKLDLYLGAMLSYNIVSFKYTNNDPSYNFYLDNTGGYGSGTSFTGFGGIRYYISDKFGLNAELGYGIAYLTLGVSFKL